MKWSHLPWPGAMSDQHPQFFEAMDMISGKVAKHEKEEAERQKRESERKSRTRGK